MKNGITDLVFILDKSGSMAGLEKDTIGGFNSMIERQKKVDGKVYVTTVLFSNDSKTIHDRVDINEIKPMTEKDYYTEGCTALMDAMGQTIHHISQIHKYGRKEDVPEHTIFVITTDGMENASEEYSADQIRKMVKHEETKYGWEFMFLAANIDAVETASRYGIRKERTSNYHATERGTANLYCIADEVVTNMRNCAPIASDWNKKLEEDE